MCACDWNYVCVSHQDTPHDWRYFLEPDEPTPDEREREAYERAALRLARGLEGRA